MDHGIGESLEQGLCAAVKSMRVPDPCMHRHAYYTPASLSNPVLAVRSLAIRAAFAAMRCERLLATGGVGAPLNADAFRAQQLLQREGWIRLTVLIARHPSLLLTCGSLGSSTCG